MTEQSLRVLITGSRNLTHLTLVFDALYAVVDENPGRKIVVVHGDAQGADRLADTVARRDPDRFVREPHPAQWRTETGGVDRGAGVRRNQEMVNLGADVCLAFYHAASENKGTRDCVRRATKAGIAVREFTQPQDL